MTVKKMYWKILFILFCGISCGDNEQYRAPNNPKPPVVSPTPIGSTPGNTPVEEFPDVTTPSYGPTMPPSPGPTVPPGDPPGSPPTTTPSVVTPSGDTDDDVVVDNDDDDVVVDNDDEEEGEDNNPFCIDIENLLNHYKIHCNKCKVNNKLVNCKKCKLLLKHAL